MHGATIKIIGVSIFIHRNIKYNSINIDEWNTDKDIEACAIQLDSTYNEIICILNIYISPMDDFKNFLERLDFILQKLYNNKYNIICGNVNVNCLTENNRKSQLDAVLHSYNLASTVKFPTRIGLNCHTAIDNYSLIHPLLRNMSMIYTVL